MKSVSLLKKSLFGSRIVNIALILIMAAINFIPIYNKVQNAQADEGGHSHLRFAHITWISVDTDPVNSARITFIAGFRRSGEIPALPCMNPLTGSSVPCSGPNGRPGIGDIIYEQVGGTRINNFGDGDSTQTLYFKVFDIDVANDWLMARALHPGTANQEYIFHQYTGTGPYTIVSESCCRTGYLAPPNAHINNPGEDYRFTAMIDFSKTTASPISLLPPIVDCPLGAQCEFKVAAVDPDASDPEDPTPELNHLRWRFATAEEMGGPTLSPIPPGATINATTGVITWTPRTCEVAPSDPNCITFIEDYNNLYSTQVIIEDRVLINGEAGDLKSRVSVDFFIRIADLPGPPPGDIRVPVRWCGLINSPSVDDPNQYSDFASLEEILDHRLVDLSNKIYVPQAQMAFISTPREQGYPTFTNTGWDELQLSGALRKTYASRDFRVALNECRRKWQETDPDAKGLIAINFRRFVSDDLSTVVTGFGVGMGPDDDERGVPGYQLISGASVIDNYYLTDTNQKWLGHEIGHALSLTHTLDPNNLDPLQSQIVDHQGNIMNDADTAPKTIEDAQRTIIRTQAMLIPGSYQIGPPPPAGGTRADTIFDTPVDEAFVDVDTSGIATSPNQSTTHFVVSTFGLFPENASGLNYYFAADLDNQSSTGGSPSDVGAPYTAQGMDVVGLVQVDVVNGAAQGTPTVWKYQNGQFTQLSDPGIEVLIGTLYGTEAPGFQIETSGPTPVAQIIQLLIPNDLLGPIAAEVRLATIAEDPTTSTVDTVEGPIYLTPPTFPSCQVNPDGALLGSTVNVTASDLLANRSISVYLGDQAIASGSTDSSGNATFDATIPINAATGTQIVYVHVDGTGVSAFCPMQLWATPKFDVPPSPVDGTPFTLSIGETLEIPIQASDLDTETGDVVTLNVIGLPSGASFPVSSPTNPASATLSWTPTTEQVGSYVVVFTAKDSFGLAATPLSVTITVTPSSDLIFTDSFESGDFSAWYWAETDGGDLSVTAQAAAIGSYGTQAVIDDSAEIVLYDHTPNDEKHFSARFYFNPNSVNIPYNSDPNQQGFYLFAGSDTSWVFCLYVEQQGEYYTAALCGKDDSGSWMQSAPVLIANEWQAIEVEWKAASVSGANDGYLKLWVNDTFVKSIENIDNDTRSITKTSFGIIDPGNSMNGTVYLDAFETHQGSHIGLDPNGPTVNPPPQPGDLVFADEFESGDLSAWISAVTDGGDLSVSTASAYQGSYGLQALLDDNSNLRAIDSSPLDETHYRARFYFDPNSLVMASGKAHFIFDGMYLDTNDAILRVELIYENGQYKLRTRVMKDNYVYINTSKYTISDDWHAVEVEWQASSALGMNDGFINFWIDGNLMETISNIDNDLHTIGEVRLGATAGVDAGTVGSVFFDNFESRRNTYIGP